MSRTVFLWCVIALGCSRPSPLTPSTSTPSPGFGIRIPADYVERPATPMDNPFAGDWRGVLTVLECRADGGFIQWCADHPIGQRLRWALDASQSGNAVVGTMEVGTNTTGSIQGTMNANRMLDLTGSLRFTDSNAVATVELSEFVAIPSTLLASDLRLRISQAGRPGSGFLRANGGAGK